MIFPMSQQTVVYSGKWSNAAAVGRGVFPIGKAFMFSLGDSRSIDRPFYRRVHQKASGDKAYCIPRNIVFQLLEIDTPMDRSVLLFRTRRVIDTLILRVSSSRHRPLCETHGQFLSHYMLIRDKMSIRHNVSNGISQIARGVPRMGSPPLRSM